MVIQRRPHCSGEVGLDLVNLGELGEGPAAAAPFAVSTMVSSGWIDVSVAKRRYAGVSSTCWEERRQIHDLPKPRAGLRA
jgi:hypothetical protein